jgi:hypothetical protein
MSSLPLHESPEQSPVLEEDISRAETYAYLEAGASPAAKTEKRRQKQREGPFADGEDEHSSDESVGKRDSYPPVNDEAEESQRVAEVCRTCCR